MALKALLCSGDGESPQHRSVLRAINTLNSPKNYIGLLRGLSPIHSICRCGAQGLMWGTRGSFPPAAATAGYGCVCWCWPLEAYVRSTYCRNSRNCLQKYFFYSYIDPIYSWHLTRQLNKEDLDLRTWAFRWCLCPVEYGRRHNYKSDIQRAFYSGYLCHHGLKAQVVYLPIGVIGLVFITELWQNDSGLLNMSGLNDYLVGLLWGNLVGHLLPCLYCDGIFANLATILPRYTNPTPDERLLNKLASQRQCIEHVFGDHRNQFKLFSVPHYLCLFKQGVKVWRECLLSFFLLNWHYCVDGTRSRYFGHAAPTLEEYIPLNEHLTPPPAIDLGEAYNFLQ
jgi:hypothetical protein